MFERRSGFSVKGYIIVILTLCLTLFMGTAAFSAQTASSGSRKNITGLVKVKGKWVYWEKGKFSRKTGITKRIDGKGGWYYVENGRLAANKTGITKRVDKKGGWYYVEKGVFRKNKTGICKRIDGKGGWYYILNGVVTKKTGIAKRVDGKGGWYFIQNGVFDTRKTGLAKRADGRGNTLYYVRNGVFQRSFSGMITVNKVKYSVNKGVAQKAGSSNSSEKAKALKAYANMLSRSTIELMPRGSKYWTWGMGQVPYTSTLSSKASFGLSYVDTDDIPELYVIEENDPYGSSVYALYTWKNGKVIRLCCGGGYDGLSGVYEKSNVVAEYSSSEGTFCSFCYSVIRGSGITPVLRKETWGYGYIPEAQPNQYYSYQNSKTVEITEGKFTSLLKQYTGGKVLKTITTRNNTAANRAKYLN